MDKTYFGVNNCSLYTMSLSVVVCAFATTEGLSTSCDVFC